MGEMEIRYALTARQKLLFLPVWLIATAERASLGDKASSIVWAAVTFWSAFFLVKARRSTTLTPYGLVIWNYRTTRLADDKEMILRAPQTAPLQRDPQFAVKVDMIRAWWHLHSGHPVEADVLPGPLGTPGSPRD